VYPYTLSDNICLAVDVMGGDHGPSITLPACFAFLKAHPEAQLILVGTEQALAPTLHWERTKTVVATEVVAMDDAIEIALRKKRDSSMRVAVSLLKTAEPSTVSEKPNDSMAPVAHACVSAGNTGALMAVSRYVLKTLEGIDRPAIATVMPNRKGGYTTMLDLGANVDCTAEHLLQFAHMGSAYVSATEGHENPSIGLLNIGEEIIKGNEVIKSTAELLRQAHQLSALNFYGNVEGNDIFKGTTNVVVCDGFVGNVALKTAEGIASMLADFIRQEFKRNAFTQLAAIVAMPVLKRFKNRVDHRRYNGAALLGLKGLVFKSHGSADAYAFEQALHRAYDAARNGLLQRIQHRMNSATPHPCEQTPS